MNFLALILLLITWLIQSAHTFKDFKSIPDLEKLGYDVHGSTPVSGDWVRYSVVYDSTFLVELGVYKDNARPGILVVFDAQTDDDDRPERLPLRDIQLGVWVHSIGRDAKDLLAIQYRDVYEDDLVSATHRVYELMGQNESEDLMVFRDHHSDNEEEAYDLLHDETPFGAGAQKMIDEFAEMQGKEVEAFGYDAQAPEVFHFTIYFWI